MTGSGFEFLLRHKCAIASALPQSGYGTREIPAIIASSRDYRALRSRAHLPGGLVTIAKTDHFTILDGLRLRGII